jgi:general secretion pathway protein K
MSHNKQTGSALLMALFISALAAIIGISLLDRQSIDIEKTSLSFDANQAYLYAQGAEIWADHLLMGDIYPKITGNNRYPWTSWPKIMPPQNLADSGTVTAMLMDAQSFYNLNNLLDENAQLSFIPLLKNILPNAYAQQAPVIFSAIVNWISSGEQVSNINIEQYYLNHQPPYQVAHALFTSVSELRLVYGINQTIYNILSPLLIALPQQTKLNINTAPAILLTTLSNNITLAQAQQLASVRSNNGGYPSVEEFMKDPAVQKLGIKQTNITTTSNYFLLRVDVKFKDVNMTIFCLFNRVIDKNNKVRVNKMWESIGTV